MKMSDIYLSEIPQFISEASQCEAVLRLQDVGMDCGCEYTSLPLWDDLIPYKRYEHSLYVGMIVYHFTHDVRQALAGVFHDIATPVFAHAIDFMNHDHLKQESTEAGTRAIIDADRGIQRLLAKHGLSSEQVADYHMYPIADNDSPKLSADRLEYTLSNLYRYVHVPHERIREYYEDLTVVINEEGEEELAFTDEKLCEEFSLKMMDTGRLYVADEDRYAMEALGMIMRRTLERGVITPDDLYTQERLVIEKLLNDEEMNRRWNEYCSINAIETGKEYVPGALKIMAKKRYINALVKDKGRIYDLSASFKAEVDEFLSRDFDYYVRGYVKEN